MVKESELRSGSDKLPSSVYTSKIEILFLYCHYYNIEGDLSNAPYLLLQCGWWHYGLGTKTCRTYHLDRWTRSTQLLLPAIRQIAPNELFRKIPILEINKHVFVTKKPALLAGFLLLFWIVFLAATPWPLDATHTRYSLLASQLDFQCINSRLARSILPEPIIKGFD